MAARLVALHGQHRVQQKDALLGPLRQITVSGRCDAQAVFDLFVNVAQAGRQGDVARHAEAEPHGLPRVVVGILSENNHLHLVDRCSIVRIEDQ